MAITKKAIADYLGISRTAVSLVLNNSKNNTLSVETREKILKAAKELGYNTYPEVSRKICYVLCDTDVYDPRYVYTIKKLEGTLNRHGYKFVLMSVQLNKPEDMEKLSDYLENDEVAGAILTGVVNDAVINTVGKTGVPCVYFTVTEKKDLNLITIDNELVGYEATKYLINLGHRKIALFTGPLSLLVHQQFCSGYKRALQEAGIYFEKAMIQANTEEDGYEMCDRMKILDIEYSAIVCANTIIQFGALQNLRENNVDVPGRVSLVGYGYTELIKICKPHLNVFAFESSKTANTIVDSLLKAMNKKNPGGNRVVLNNIKLFEGGTAAVYNDKD